MSDETRITRSIDTELAPDELWSLVHERWAEWMVDTAEIDVDPGASGTIVDDGVRRDVHVDRVEPRTSVTFTWWPQAQPDEASTVELVVIPAPTGSRLRVTETYARAEVTSLRWDVRAMLLVARALVLV